MHKSATKCNETLGKWCKNKHGASKIIDTFETYQGMPKNSLFLRFRAIFMSYCPQIWGSRVIYEVNDTQFMFERHQQELVIFAFMVIFVSYCSQYWDFGVIYKAHDT
jgi:hypothetical protein